MKRTLKFLQALAKNNNRDWFQKHKEEYLEIKNGCEKLTKELLTVLSEYEPEASRLRVADCTYRIYRDTRFSNDKTPYKTHIGIFMNPPGGKKALTSGYYLHIQPGESFFCCGSYNLPGKLVKKQRESIYEEIEEFRGIVENSEFKELYPKFGMNPVKTTPQGFPKDWQWIDYIRPRDLGAIAPLSDEFIASPDLAERLRPYLWHAKKLNDFLNFPITDD